MIRLEHTVEPSTDQMMFVIEEMRNPMNSWDKSDSNAEPENIGDFGEEYGSIFVLGPNDKMLMKKLAKAGTDHRKFMRMMPVMVRITAPLYWWKEFDTYKVGTVTNSCSTMHKIQAKRFKHEDFSIEHLKNCGEQRSYNQTRNVMLNYEVLYNMYRARKNHKLDEWREFCKWIETLEFSFLIIGEDVLKEGLEEGLHLGV